MKTTSLKTHKGFTLIELIVTITIAGILMAIAIPSFMSTINSNRLTTYTNELVASINLARSEAIKRGVQVTITRTSTTAGTWEGGWDVFLDSDASDAFNDDNDATLCETNTDGSPSEDCLLRTVAALPNGYTIRTAGSTTIQNFLAYLPSGLSKGSPVGTFKICDSTATTANSRSVALSASGRASVSKGTALCP